MKVKDYFKVNEVFGYYFRKKDPARATNFNLRMMHGVNKLSMIMFLICIVVMIVRYIVRH